MKALSKNFLKYYLKFITKVVLWLHKPTIIAVAGSNNKTIVKEVITAVLKKKGLDVRSNPKSFNTEIGMPLAILNLDSGYNSYRNWLPILKNAFFCLWQKDFPKYLVLELGTSDPGDMKYLLTIIKPYIVVITDITQRYLESFSDMDELVMEYKELVKNIPSSGLIILNNDNIRIRELVKVSPAHCLTFGFSGNSDYRVTDNTKIKNGQSISLSHGPDLSQHEINRFGKHHAYAFIIGHIIANYEPLSRQ